MAAEPKTTTDHPAALASTSAPVPTESDVYDRQIRLWGADAQSKMSSAQVLYINTTGISSEILKNLVLAGVHASIADGRTYPDAMAHTPSSFLPSRERLVLNKEREVEKSIPEAQDDTQNKKEENGRDTKKMKKMTVARAMAPCIEELNPLLPKCEINEEKDIESIPAEFLKQFDIIIASQISLQQATYITKSTATSDGKKAKFYLVHSFGFFSCALVDLGANHEYRQEIGKELSDIQTVKDYLTLEEMMSVKLCDVKDRWHKNGPPIIYAKFRSILHYYSVKKAWPDEKNVSDFIQVTKEFLVQQGLKEDYIGDDSDLGRLSVTATAEVSPVCAVLGGVLGNEVIKAISGRGEPANNILLFDGLDGGCKSFTLKKP